MVDVVVGFAELSFQKSERMAEHFFLRIDIETVDGEVLVKYLTHNVSGCFSVQFTVTHLALNRVEETGFWSRLVLQRSQV